MKKIYIKLAASVLSILAAFTMMIGATYAWLTLSKSPEAGGISVTLGGSKSIMLAADLTKTVTDASGNPVTVHYPGAFSNRLKLSQYDTYDYLETAAHLSPVSTADGLYWLLPAYDEETGMLKPVEQFTVDSTLQNANVEGENGSYIYLDFWMVSPGSEYNIRLSMDTRSKTGSFLTELPGVREGEDGSLQLSDAQGIVGASARVGFLVNTQAAAGEDMTAYISSEEHNSHYKNLQGVYPEKGQEPSGEYHFAIYEPNGTSHPSEALTEGKYVITNPLCYNPYGHSITEENVNGRLMVQGANTLKTLGESSQLAQIFKSFIINKKDLTADTAASMFYGENLQGQVGAYVKSGDFYKSTAALYEAAQNGVVSAESMEQMNMAGATDDCIITTLAANTPQRIRMYIWLEGQDADCANVTSVEASRFALNLEFSGADQ